MDKEHTISGETLTLEVDQCTRAASMLLEIVRHCEEHAVDRVLVGTARLGMKEAFALINDAREANNG